MAYFFGTTFLNDAFNVAYNLPNLIRRLFGEGALSAAFVPLYNEIGIRSNKKQQLEFALNVLSILTLFLTALTLIGIAFAPLIVKVLYPGLPLSTMNAAIKLSRIIFPYLFFIGMSSTMIAILNSHDYFFMTGLSSGLLNIGMISLTIIPAAVLNASGEELLIWSGWGVFLGGLLQTAVNFPFLRKIGYSFKLFIRFSGESISILWKRFIPSMIGIGIREINLIADALMASFLPVGSITALGMGNRLMQMPLGIFGISTGTAILPVFSKNVTEGKWDDLSQNLRFATESLVAVMLPVTALIIVLGTDLTQALFQRGLFDDKASLMTYQALVFYSLGLVFYGLNQTVTPLFYANKDTKTPVRIASFMVALNIILNLILMQFMQHRGLALSTTLTAAVNYFLLLHLVKKRFPKVILQNVITDIFKIFLINLILGVSALFLRNLVNWQNIYAILACDLIIALIYIFVLLTLSYLCNIKFYKKMLRSAWTRLTRN